MSKTLVSVLENAPKCDYTNEDTRKFYKNGLHATSSRGWKLHEVDWNEESVLGVAYKPLSLGDFEDGYKTKQNWNFATGFMLDFDKGELSFDDLVKWQKDLGYNSVITTSLGYSTEQEKMHMWIPFRVGQEVKSVEIYEKISKWAIDTFGDALDASSVQVARYWVPGLPKSAGGRVSGIYDGKWFDVKSFGNTGLWNKDDFVKTAAGNRVMLKDLEVGARIYCPFCGDSEERDGDGDNAVYAQKEGYTFPIIFCSSCQSRGYGKDATGVYLCDSESVEYYKSNAVHQRRAWFETTYHNFMFCGKRLFRYVKSADGDDYEVGEVRDSAIELPADVLDRDSREEVKLWERARKRFLDRLSAKAQTNNLIKVKHLDVECDEVWCKLDRNFLHVFYPAPAVVEDRNKLIEEFLRGRFGTYYDYEVDRQAVFCYQKFDVERYEREALKAQPINIIYAGRGTGKSTYGNFLRAFIPRGTSDFKEALGQFNSELNNKQVIFDESILGDSNDGKRLYQLCKQNSGQKYKAIRDLYAAKVDVPNDCQFVILSNSYKALWMSDKEAPEDEMNNNFFVYRFGELTGKRDREIENKLISGAGHWIRTVLRERWEEIQARPGRTECRFQIPVPITDEQMAMYAVSETNLEAAAKSFWEIVEEAIDGVNVVRKYHRESAWLNVGNGAEIYHYTHKGDRLMCNDSIQKLYNLYVGYKKNSTRHTLNDLLKELIGLGKIARLTNRIKVKNADITMAWPDSTSGKHFTYKIL